MASFERCQECLSWNDERETKSVSIQNGDINFREKGGEEETAADDAITGIFIRTSSAAKRRSASPSSPRLSIGTKRQRHAQGAYSTQPSQMQPA